MCMIFLNGMLYINMVKIIQEDISREKKELKKELIHVEEEETLVKNKAVILKEKEKHQEDEF